MLIEGKLRQDLLQINVIEGVYIPSQQFKRYKQFCQVLSHLWNIVSVIFSIENISRHYSVPSLGPFSGPPFSTIGII